MQDFSGWWLNQTNQKESLGTTVGVFLMLTQKKKITIKQSFGVNLKQNILFHLGML